ncbi:MAG: carboxypeptidase regulatory-like domain-containing protein [Bryobacterales bacterium]|nr:carboxypeptidase regulatory-like domain-containing protein [Bryobacterales bacterium]
MTRVSWVVAAFVILSLIPANLPAQAIYATLTGVVSDQSEALVTQATVRLRDERSNSMRETVTNNQGYYTFASVPVGTYELTVEAAGFAVYRETGVALGGGERRNINVSLKIGATTESVVVQGTPELLVPVDSGEKSTTLNVKQLQNFVQVGSNAAEFIKIMPGFGIQNGITNAANYSGQTIGINANGNAGSQSPLNNAYSYNGLPGNTLDITADGAHVSDPGCNCDTPVNPNSEMIAEFKITMSNFSAETQKGPAVISSVAKSGGTEFHGSGFMYGRDYRLNSNDWISNASSKPRPENKYYYPGFTLGGPLVIPKTGLDRNSNKLFFYTGYQYFYQVLDTGLLRAAVPTEGMRNGNFSPAELEKMGAITASGGPPSQINARNLALYPNGIIPATAIDKNMQALMNLYPKPNADPNATGGYNWTDDLTFNQNNHQWLTRVDYNISDNTKLFVRYNLQRELQRFPIQVWSNNTTQQLPYPSSVLGKNRSDSVTASLTHVFSPSMTNEVVFGYTFIGFPNVFEDPDKVDPAKVGFNYKLVYKNNVAQIPNFSGSSEMARINNYGGFEVGGPSAGLYANKWLPSFSDTLTKVLGRHTFKAGFFFEWIRNAQPASNASMGAMTFNHSSSNSLGNDYADMLIGNLNSFQQYSFNRVNDISYKTYEGFLQDSWKIHKRFTLELGMRITHFTPWIDRLGYGFSIFDYSKYNASCTPTQYCGFLWNKRDPSVPLGGFPTRSAFYQPRFGIAYDLFGDGRTVIRGGWGMYYFHSGQFTTGLDVAAGVQTINLSNNQGIGPSPYVVGSAANATPLMARDLDNMNVAARALSPGAVDAVDDRQPLTKSYSFTIAQRMPWSSLLEVAYVGNESTDLAYSGGPDSNINRVPVGAMLSSANGGVDPNTLIADNFRPLKGFSNLNLATHGAYANYNSLQTTWTRARGRYTLSMNYTFSKALGIQTGTGTSPSIGDQFNMRNNYGVMPSNRTHIFNAAYSVELGNFARNRIAGGFVNGWQVSGLLQLQSGANLTGYRSNDFGMNTNSYKIPGTTFNVSNVSLLGTPNLSLRPLITCDPTANLGENQYLDQACFAMPTQVGQNGPNTLPVIYGPGFFNADLGLFKNFDLSESKRLQFRFNGYNFLNHPLWSFSNQNLTLGFDRNTGKLNTPLFGYVTEKQGRRVIQLAVKFIF